MVCSGIAQRTEKQGRNPNPAGVRIFAPWSRACGMRGFSFFHGFTGLSIHECTDTLGEAAGNQERVAARPGFTERQREGPNMRRMGLSCVLGEGLQRTENPRTAEFRRSETLRYRLECGSLLPLWLRPAC